MCASRLGPVRVAVLLLLALGLLAGAPASRAAVELPPDAARLLPADASAVLVFLSLDEAERTWARLDAIDAPPPMAARRAGSRRAAASDGPRALLARFAPDLAAHVDGGRPIALSVSLPPPLAGRPVAYTLALPLRGRAFDPGFPRRRAALASASVRGRYAAVSTDPRYKPADAAPALVSGLPDGVIVARIDLARMSAMYRPFLELAMMAFLQRGAQAPAGETRAAMPPLSPEQIASIQEFARGLFDSAQRLDLALTDRDGPHRLSGSLTVAPASLLDLGPQPEFARALALSGVLAPDLPYVQVEAWEASRLVDRVVPLYGALMSGALTKTPPAFRESYLKWLADGTAATKQLMRGCALGLAFGPGGFRMQAVAAPAEPERALRDFIDVYTRLGPAGLGFSVTEGPPEEMDGVNVRTFTVAADPEQLSRLMGEPQDAKPGAGPSAAQMAALLAGLYPPIRAAALPDLVVTCADRDPDAMRSLLARARAQASEVRPALRAATERSGPGTQCVARGDLGDFIRGAASMFGPAFAGQLPTGSAAFTIAAGRHETGLDFALDVDMEGLAALARAMDRVVGPRQGEKERPAGGR